ncbi:AMP-binding protein [Streptomyces sp. NPDC016309]|uniref:AMP-binding protein n=1 Tax=Streptomyces sp. NPDC016309 TaxID=3364965 RepID=UPI0036F6BCD6
MGTDRPPAAGRRRWSAASLGPSAERLRRPWSGQRIAYAGAGGLNCRGQERRWGAPRVTARRRPVGGAPLDRALAERTARAWGGRLQRVFALPEGVVTLTRPAGPEGTVPHTQGWPLSPDDELRVAGPDGEDVPDGRTGELLARGPSVPRGYYRAPGHDARSFTPDGYLRTGMLARRTPDGDLVVSGRKTEDLH